MKNHQISTLMSTQIPLSYEISWYMQIFEVHFNLATYHSFADVINYLNALAITYPERVSVQPIGTTHEGRQIPLIKVNSHFCRISPHYLCLPTIWNRDFLDTVIQFLVYLFVLIWRSGFISANFFDFSHHLLLLFSPSIFTSMMIFKNFISEDHLLRLCFFALLIRDHNILMHKNNSTYDFNLEVSFVLLKINQLGFSPLKFVFLELQCLTRRTSFQVQTRKLLPAYRHFISRQCLLLTIHFHLRYKENILIEVGVKSRRICYISANSFEGII